MKYVKCSKCGKTDKPDKSVIPHNVGTAVTMHCSDCDGQEHIEVISRYQGGLATKCRACCPTGHGTRWEE